MDGWRPELRASYHKERLEYPEIDVLRKANAIAWDYKITIHDSRYLTRAEQVGYPLITPDEVIVKKLIGHSIVVPLREHQS